MLRLLLALLIVATSTAPMAALAQGGDNLANAVSNITADTAETANAAEPVNSAGEAATDPRELPRTTLDASGEALMKLFVLAVILESALALLFNWRPFVARYDGRGVKAPITLLAALALVFVFEPDVIAKLMSGYGPQVTDAGRFFARFIEAMVIAGGSAGVNRLFVALGFRSVTRAQEVVARPRPDEAWISVGLDRQSAQGPVYVEIEVEGRPAEIAGTITGTRGPTRSYFRRDSGRLPQSGGWSVPPGQTIAITLVDLAGKRSATWGPHRLAQGAIVDIDLLL